MKWLRKKYKNDKPIVHPDFLIAKFLGGLSDDKIKEQLAPRTFKNAHQAFEAASLIESTNSTPKRKFQGQGRDQPGPPKRARFSDSDQQRGQNTKGKSYTCYKCSKSGHRSFECPMNVGSIKVLPEVVTYTKSNKSSDLLARIGDAITSVTMDTGADINCISRELAEQAGVKEMNKVQGPDIHFASTHQAEPLGMAEIMISFHKDMDPQPMKFLVFEELSPACLIGVDGQDQLKIRLDREQDLIWIMGQPITLSRSEPEALVSLGSLSFSTAFEKKVKDYELGKADSKRDSDYYSSLHTDALTLDDLNMSLEPYESNIQDVNIEPSLSPSEKAKILEFLKSSKHMFGYFENDKGNVSSATTVLTHKIVTDGTVVKAKPYRMSPAQLEIVKAEIDKMLELGIISKSQSNYASPVVLVPKPDGSWRFCVDYRNLNKHTKSDLYPIPNIQERLSRFAKAKFFAKYDLAAGYWQILMDLADREKTAFVTPFGLFEFNVMPFGLKTAPATFQRMMDVLLGDLEGITIYLDDILVHGETLDEVQKISQEVFHRLDQANLKLRAKKCFIGQTSIDYLGYVVTDTGIKADTSKVDSIKAIETPQNVRQLRRFLGMASYYRNFIQHFATTAKPLTELTSKKIKFDWTNKHQDAFDSLKASLCQAPVLTHPDYSKPFTIFSDASNVGVGAVLTQNGQPIWFSSRALSDAERKYDTREKETIAIMFGLDKFKPYFFGRPVTVMTDHGNLRWLMDHAQKGRLARWQLFLQQFDFHISYVKGQHNPVADCLSRSFPDNNKEIRIAAVRTSARLAKLKAQKSLAPTNIETVNTEIQVSPSAKASPRTNQTLADYNWRAEQQADPFIQHQLRDLKLPFVLEDGILHRLKSDTFIKRIVLPEHLIDSVLHQAHNADLAGHGGVRQTSYHLRAYWFPSFRSRIESYCRQCAVCLNAKGFGKECNTLSSRVPYAVLERVYMDVVGPLPNDTRSYVKDARYILTMIDDGSRYLKAVALPNAKRDTIITAFRDHWIATFGAPRVVRTDNNEQFKGTFAQFCASEGIENEYTAPYSPEMNAVERSHGSLMSRVRALRYTTLRPWSECLHKACLGYNVTEHSMLGAAPFTVLYGKDFDVLHNRHRDIPEMQQYRASINSQAHKKREDRLGKINESRNDQDLQVGDMVYVRSLVGNKLSNKVLEGQFEIIQREAKNVFKLKAKNGKYFRRSRKDIYKL